MKRIQRERRRRSTEEANEQVEGWKAEGAGGIDIGRRRKDCRRNSKTTPKKKQ